MVIKTTKKLQILVLVMLLFFFKLSIAQDIIYTKDGREVKVNIIENNGSTVKYKDYNQSEGLVKTFDINYIDFIKYENGTIERYVITEKQNSAQTQNSISPSIEFLTRKYERNKLMMYVADGIVTVGFVGALCGLLSDEPDVRGGLVGGGLVLASVGAIIFYTSRYKVNYLDERIKELSIIISPTELFHAKIDPSPGNISVGIRLRF